MEAKVTLCRELEQIYPGKIFRRLAGVGTAGAYCAAIKDSPPAGPTTGHGSADAEAAKSGKDEGTARGGFCVPSAVKKPVGRRPALRAFNVMAAKGREGKPKQ